MENLTLTGTGAINGTGNSLNNTITGNIFDNILSGLGGDDILEGEEGKDILYGGDGNDILNGKYNTYYDTDILDGGNGNDTYITDSNYGIDKIVEAANSGIDTVQSFTSYTLGSNLENLTLTRGIAGTGNSLNNIIIGNTGNNILSGLAGNDNSSGSVGERDTLTGGTGRDTFLLGNLAQVFYDDGKTATAGTGDYASITDFNTTDDVIELNESRTDYRLAASPAGLPVGTAIYRNKPTGEKDELIAIIQGSSGLNLNGSYFKFTVDEVYLSNLNGSNGFKINGIDTRDFSGFSVSNAGDVNGDGFDDLIIGAPFADPNAQNSGESYVVFGKADEFDASLNLSTLNGSNGFVINSIDARDRSGSSVSSAGDVNKDGYDDLLIGAPGADPKGQDGAGESYVIFGRADFTAATLSVGTLEPFNELFASGNTSNAVMSPGQNLPFDSTTAADNIFFDLHNAWMSPLSGGTAITQMII